MGWVFPLEMYRKTRTQSPKCWVGGAGGLELAISQEETQGGFVKGRFWRMYPHSGLLGLSLCFCTLIPVLGIRCSFFCTVLYPCSGFWYREKSAKSSFFGNHPFAKPQTFLVIINWKSFMPLMVLSLRKAA